MPTAAMLTPQPLRTRRTVCCQTCWWRRAAQRELRVLWCVCVCSWGQWWQALQGERVKADAQLV